VEAHLANTEVSSERFEPASFLLLVQIRFYCAIAAVGGAAIFCWAWSGFSVHNMAANYRWNELIFSAIAVIVLRRRAFPLAVGTAIFAGLWVIAAFLWMDRFLP
jgi:hypothetical protein